MGQQPVRSSARPLQLPLQVSPHRRPLPGNHTVNASVAQGAVSGHCVAAQNAVQLRAKPFDGPAASRIHEVCPKFNRDTSQSLKRVPQQQEFGFCIQGRPLHPLRIPGGTDLHPRARRVDVHIGRHAHGLPCGGLDNGKGQHGTGRLQREPSPDLFRHRLRRGRSGVPESPQLAIARSLDQRLAVFHSKRQQMNKAASQGDRLAKGVRHKNDSTAHTGASPTNNRHAVYGGPYNRMMRSFAKLSAVLGLLAGFFGSAYGQSAGASTPPAGRVVLVLPFENRSGNPSLNWIGDSFPDTLDRRLDASGFLTISHDDRVYAYGHLGLPEGFRPSRATSIRIAQQLDANYVVIGSFTVASNHLSAQAQVLSVEQLRLSPAIGDGADLSHLFDAENAVAWKLARAIDPRFAIAESTFLAAPGAVPLPAFEDYIRGTNATAPSEKLQRLKEAVSFSPDFASALLALGKEQYATRDFDAAAATLSKVPPASPLSLEAGFYLGLSRFNSASYPAAETAFAFVAQHLPLPEVVNNEAVAQSRQGKDAVPLFQNASTADPSDEDYRYNLAVALFRRGETAGAQREADAALKLRPNDNEALQLRNQLHAVPAGTRLPPAVTTGFSPLERIRRAYSETSYRQAAFQLEQLRSARLALLTPAQQAAEYDMLGRDALSHGLLPEAETRFVSAAAADPKNADAHAGLAEVREGSGDAAGAHSEALASLRLQPNAPALLVLARLDLAQNALGVAAAEVSQALALDPKNAAGQTLRGTLIGKGQAVR